MVSAVSRWIIYGSLACFGLSIILPFVYLILVSLTNETAIQYITWDKITFNVYGVIFSNSRFVDAFVVSFLRTAVGTLCNMMFSVLMAYAVSKRDLPGRRGIMIYIIFTMVFTGGLIPNYLLVTFVGLSNTFWVMIVPTLINAFYLILIRNFFMEIPLSLEESAKMDGANDYVTLIRVILPLSKPVLATISLFYAVFHWNEWFSVLIYIRKADLWPVQVLLRNLIIQAGGLENMMDSTVFHRVTPEAVKMASVIVATIPIAMVYPFVQKYFIRGIMVGSVKG